jgi:superfamily II DNA or RNA helicase
MADVEFSNIYKMTPNIVTTSSVYPWKISYKVQLTPSEVKQYQKMKATKSRHIEEREHKKAMEKARIGELRREFEEWLALTITGTKATIEQYEQQSAKYVEQVNTSYKLNEEVESKLLRFQINPTKQIINAIKYNRRVLLASDTGIGKTYMILAALKQLGISACVVCPKTLKTTWRDASAYMGVHCTIYSYEKFKSGNNPFIKKWQVNVGESELVNKTCEMMKAGWTPHQYKNVKVGKGASARTEIVLVAYRYADTAINSTFFIFDEAHMCKKETTQNGIIFNQLKKQNGYGAAISATIIDDEKFMYGICDFLNITDKLTKGIEFHTWIDKLIEKSKVPEEYHVVLKEYEHDPIIKANIEKIKINGKVTYIYKSNRVLQILHRNLLPYTGNRITIKAVGDEFPSNLIVAGTYDMNEAIEPINNAYKQMENDLKNIKEGTIENRQLTELLIKYQQDIISEEELFILNDLAKKRDYDLVNYKLLYDHEKKTSKNANEHLPLVITLRAKQKIELLKMDNVVENIVQHLYEGKRVVVFVEFRETLYGLHKKLSKNFEHDDGQNVIPIVSMIHGRMDNQERDINIANFQSNKSNVMLATLFTGGNGISLHDTDGNYPRVSLFMSIPNKAIAFKQALGRIHRAKGKSKCLQIIICCRGTIEEKMAERLKKKLDCIDDINDGDVSNLINFDG